jgi:hypothetical protein
MEVWCEPSAAMCHTSKLEYRSHHHIVTPLHISGQYTSFLTLKYMAHVDYCGFKANIIYICSTVFESTKWRYGPKEDEISTHCHITINNTHHQRSLRFVSN